MTRSLGLTLYALTAGRREAPLPDWPACPEGRVVWLHAPGAGSVQGLVELGLRLRAEAGLSPVLTAPPGTAGPVRGLVVTEPPPDTGAAARAFLDRFRPVLGILAEGELRPMLLRAADDRGVSLMLVDGRAPVFPAGVRPLWPGMTRAILSRFRHVLAVDDEAARQFRRRGAPESVLAVPGRMEEGRRVLPCTEAERAALAQQLKSRPVWFAACVPEAEEAAVIAAHRAVLRMAHRMLLILAPETPERAAALAESLAAAEGWGTARRSAEEEADDDVQVYLAEGDAEYGLWYRLAPVTWLGGSLAGPGCARDPFEAAQLGSAILCGPRVGGWGAAFDRLAEARAVRQVETPAALAEALGDLLAPNRAARLAQAAWAVASAGSEVTDEVVRLARALTNEAA